MSLAYQNKLGLFAPVLFFLKGKILFAFQISSLLLTPFLFFHYNKPQTHQRHHHPLFLCISPLLCLPFLFSHAESDYTQRSRSFFNAWRGRKRKGGGRRGCREQSRILSLTATREKISPPLGSLGLMQTNKQHCLNRSRAGGKNTVSCASSSRSARLSHTLPLRVCVFSHRHRHTTASVEECYE